MFRKELSYDTGQKLKKLRLLRDLAQQELTIKAGLTDDAIRNYELGNRSPTKEQMQKIAQALDCDISALTDHEPNSTHEFIHIIFDYEKEMKLRLLIDKSTNTLLSHDMNFNDFLVEWDEMRKNIIIVQSQTKNLRIGSYPIRRNQDS
nr:helix-turn-helix transcriptional regulator [Solobacterium moorei]